MVFKHAHFLIPKSPNQLEKERLAYNNDLVQVASYLFSLLAAANKYYHI